eukprot:SAG22_NODE_1084_length_5637_cov_2.170820_5_plen_150_part_00
MRTIVRYGTWGPAASDCFGQASAHIRNYRDVKTGDGDGGDVSGESRGTRSCRGWAGVRAGAGAGAGLGATDVERWSNCKHQVWIANAAANERGADLARHRHDDGSENTVLKPRATAEALRSAPFAICAVLGVLQRTEVDHHAYCGARKN